MSGPNPPKWADWLIEKCCASPLVEEVQGDLHEAYHWRLKEKGISKAKWFFIFEVLRSIRPSNLKPTHYLTQYLMMYKNYIKTGWRFLKKHKLYSGLNILGLALGISFCWLAYLYANDETSFDEYLSNHESLYRIVIDIQRGDNIDYIGGSSNAMTVLFDEQIPEIESVARFKSEYGVIKKGEETLDQPYIIADQSIISYLDLKFLEGSGNQFDQPNDAIISESLAGKLNLRGKAVGEIISLANGGEGFEDFIIRGVYKDIPENTSVRRDMIVSYANYLANAPERRLTQWFDINMNSLIKLTSPQAKIAAEQKMNKLHQENEPEDITNDNVTVVMRLQPISEIHLNSDYGQYNGITRGGNTELIRLFASIGIFCLIISMINYSNFNISLYINRAREVALRKVIGAEKSGIFSQLITESFLSAIISGVIALALLVLILPTFSSFVQKNYTLDYLINTQFILGAIGILVFVAFISGVYPALVLSRFQIIKSLKGEQKIKSGKWITQSLLGVQFIIATVLVAGMLTMNSQIKYLSTFDTKIDTENVICLDYIQGDESNIKPFVNELSQLPDVQSVAAISGYNGTRTKGENPFGVRHLRIHKDLLKLLDIEVVRGKNFDEELSDQSQYILVNEAFVAKMGVENPIGEIAEFEYGDLKNPKIIGVVEDYHFQSAKSTVDPLVIYQAPAYPLQSAYFKLSPGSTFSQEKFASVWAKYFDPFPFEFSFLEDVYQQGYKQEERMMQLVAIGCFVSIFLAAMGLLGIVGLQLNQRLKEISIRKVLGATPGNLYRVFTSRFIVIILIGLVLGIGVGSVLINGWLEDYPFHVDFDGSIISLTAIITLAIALITIISQVFKVTKTNPAQYLKDE
ncbi:MAG: FtsX-like permease family protein [Ekhidna sp.]|uniref:FtsX-like permease family protein n=1 Tax=Ekhidna sp. TaxID=2608089 RepID=UPI0032EC68B7